MPSGIVMRELAFEPTRGKRVRATTKTAVSRRLARSKDLVAPPSRYPGPVYTRYHPSGMTRESGRPPRALGHAPLLPTDETPAHDLLANARGEVQE